MSMLFAAKIGLLLLQTTIDCAQAETKHEPNTQPE
jgi:hypothetical protein